MSVDETPAAGGRVANVYYVTSALFTLAASIIWGVNTLFLLDAGLDIFQVMIVNATFSAGQIVFEVPTGVIADTLGRRFSFLLGICALILGTLAYVGSASFEWGLVGFILASIVLGFGYTCQTGAVDAWLVDALDHTRYPMRKDQVFARGGMVNGVSMLVGTLGGGLLGQLDLAVPYLVRTGFFFGAFAVTFIFMRDLGFEPRPLRLECFADETRKIFRAGVTYGWRHPVVRPLLFVSLADGLLLWDLFYASQPYALELLGREDLIWVAGAVTALFALSGVIGNGCVGPISRTRIGSKPALVLALASGGMALSAVGMGVTGLVAPPEGGIPGFAVAALLLASFSLLYGIVVPIRQAYINDFIPSAQRATVLSVDSFFGDVGAVIGQPGLGYAARTTSKALAYALGGLVYSVAVPLYRRAGRVSEREPTIEGDASGDMGGEARSESAS